MKIKRSFAVLMIFFVLTIPETKQISEKDEDSEIIEFPYMASYGQLEVVKYLVQILPDNNPENAKGKTPLDMAKAKGHQEIVDFLETLINQS